MVHYEGKRTPDGCRVSRQEDEQTVPLPLRLDLWNHSPTGFEWGYGGSGPAQLALALLADALGDEERAVALHQPFKWEVISRLPAVSWRLSAEEIAAYVRQIEERRQG